MQPWLFALYAVFFGVLLSFPASQLIWTFSVRRLQRRLDRELSEEELKGQRRRALILALFVCIIFSFFFSSYSVGISRG